MSLAEMAERIAAQNDAYKGGKGKFATVLRILDESPPPELTEEELNEFSESPKFHRALSRRTVFASLFFCLFGQAPAQVAVQRERQLGGRSRSRSRAAAGAGGRSEDRLPLRSDSYSPSVSPPR